ncbi:hypothetical protein [Epibacterium ulvae]|uniref:hypothetical protein n=1 Tax=Epibacterium ulvae TaxID=1156985 RepID=UPI00248FAB64|nr:hypothetical protein [Epibacterium ulvae]
MTQREAFLWLCRNAAWEDTKHRVGSEMIDCPKGCVFITLREFQATTSWGSDTKIRNFLQGLENAGLIKRSTHGKRNARKTRVTICEYAENTDEQSEGNARKTHRERTKNAVKEEVNNKQSSEAKASSSGAPSPLPANEQSKAVARYNDAAEAAGWPKIAKLNPNRAKLLKARLADCGGPEGWEVALRKAFESDFCRGRTAKPWLGFSFDWMIKAANFTKLMEGNYDNRTGSNPEPSNRPGNGANAALEQALRLAGVGATPGHAGDGMRVPG